MEGTINVGDVLQILALVGGIAGSVVVVVWAGGRWTSRIEASVEGVKATLLESRTANTIEHAAIISRVDNHPVHATVAQHGERIANLERGGK